ncbi:hypothetical protein BP00DRAFT_449914 [Aspergillus indologenus CBS 114.80]|uniref:Uncharacterized protein n=1 Tax=Aspergillus indologenus CBS 114.80 TaxID=1450541 RepID=A0A2V5HTS8_9EURO|nr:hypothetical protein BP00DRAFT_449914 [Aspergillus indologenus CBS 114.80]
MFSRAFSRPPLRSSVSSVSSSPKEGPVHPSDAATPSVSFLQPVTRVFSAFSSFFSPVRPVRPLEGASPRSILVKPVDGDVRTVKPKKQVSFAEADTVSTVSRWLVPGVNVWADKDLTDPSIREYDMIERNGPRRSPGTPETRHTDACVGEILSKIRLGNRCRFHLEVMLVLDRYFRKSAWMTDVDFTAKRRLCWIDTFGNLFE